MEVVESHLICRHLVCSKRKLIDLVTMSFSEGTLIVFIGDTGWG